jgi:superfamily I DNA and RNA helicase
VHGPIVGQAWSPKASEEIGEVTVAVGLGRSGAVAERMEDQRDRIAELEAENEALKTQQQEIKNRLAALEAERSPSVVAGLAGSGTGLLLAFLLGGLLGAGLIWRRQG